MSAQISLWLIPWNDVRFWTDEQFRVPGDGGHVDPKFRRDGLRLSESNSTDILKPEQIVVKQLPESQVLRYEFIHIVLVRVVVMCSVSVTRGHDLLPLAYHHVGRRANWHKIHASPGSGT